MYSHQGSICQKSSMGILPLLFLFPSLSLSFPLPFLSLVFPSLPPSPPSLPFPFPFLPLDSFPFPSLPLEVGHLNPTRGSGGALLAPPVGSGVEPQPKWNLVHFSLKIWHLVATILIIFLRIKSGASTQGGNGAKCTMAKMGGGNVVMIIMLLLVSIIIYYYMNTFITLHQCTLNLLFAFFFYTVSQKTSPDVFSYNSRKHCRIFIIYGRNITEKVGNQ